VVPQEQRWLLGLPQHKDHNNLDLEELLQNN
jgi:hypothetical protein